MSDMEWRTFDTAPKDGKPVVVWRDDAGWFTAIWGSPAELYEGHEDDAPDNWEEQWWTTEGEDLADDLPSHWMRPTKPGGDHEPG